MRYDCSLQNGGHFQSFSYATTVLCRVVARLPGSVVLPLSYVAETVTTNLEPLGVKPSDFTPFRMKVLTRWKVYSGERAKKLLGYTPEISVEVSGRPTAGTAAGAGLEAPCEPATWGEQAET